MSSIVPGEKTGFLVIGSEEDGDIDVGVELCFHRESWDSPLPLYVTKEYLNYRAIKTESKLYETPIELVPQNDVFEFFSNFEYRRFWTVQNHALGYDPENGYEVEGEGDEPSSQGEEFDFPIGLILQYIVGGGSAEPPTEEELAKTVGAYFIFEGMVVDFDVSTYYSLENIRTEEEKTDFHCYDSFVEQSYDELLGISTLSSIGEFIYEHVHSSYIDTEFLSSLSFDSSFYIPDSVLYPIESVRDKWYVNLYERSGTQRVILRTAQVVSSVSDMSARRHPTIFREEE